MDNPHRMDNPIFVRETALREGPSLTNRWCQHATVLGNMDAVGEATIWCWQTYGHCRRTEAPKTLAYYE